MCLRVTIESYKNSEKEEVIFKYSNRKDFQEEAFKFSLEKYEGLVGKEAGKSMGRAQKE